MRVTFTKVAGRRYQVGVDREHGPRLVPRFAPGYDDLMPHDLAHYVVEEYFGIRLGVWGQLAAGGGGIFYPAPEDNTLRHQRRVQRLGSIGRDDMIRSEGLAQSTVAAWERTIGRGTHQLGPSAVHVDAEELAGAVVRMGEASARWQALAQGASMTLTWPRRLEVDVSKTSRGRRTA